MPEKKPELKAFRKKNYSELAYESLKDYITQYRKQAGPEDELKLPPEVELADSMSISRATIRQVLTQLETEGMIYRIHGKGTFVNRDYQDLFFPFVDPVHLIENEGHKAESRNLRIEAVSGREEICRDLGLQPGSRLWELDTLYTADGTPCMALRDWIPARNPDRAIHPEQLGGGFSDFLHEETGRIGSHEYTTVSAAAESVVGEHFPGIHFPSSAVIVVEALVYSQDREPICKTLAYFDPAYASLHFFGKVMAD